ncbi:ion transporter [Flavobacterium hiemivividum]|uniref:Ion transporter n=1 Tax=Flavobacterium hiemivividum TaxID=2541734 RepID=A0A4R5D0Z4_9FLAO|nr:ion transporter [Flavobacterium hiemivividum]TDE05480.1 ion transporter [Flavobacterium hiemivividum]
MPDIKSKYERFRQKVNIIIHGTGTKAGRLFDLILLGLIVLSVLLVMMETVSGFDTKYHRTLVLLEWIITGLFTLEYLLRIISINKPWKYIFSFYGIIDLLAILPMYLSFFVVGTSVLTVIRSLRLLRLFKILNHPKFITQSTQLNQAVKASRGKIIVFIYFVLISTILIGSIMFLVEGRENGFTSIPVSIYWTIVTLTTVGYGDISPATPLGQFIASLVMILGYGIIAVPTGIVTAEIAKSAQNLALKPKKPCSACGNEDHPEDANYCPHCGHSFTTD